MRVKTGDGVSLHIARGRGIWRPWRWWLHETGKPVRVDGRTWTRRTAVEHGGYARALRIIGNELATTNQEGHRNP